MDRFTVGGLGDLLLLFVLRLLLLTLIFDNDTLLDVDEVVEDDEDDDDDELLDELDEDDEDEVDDAEAERLRFGDLFSKGIGDNDGGFDLSCCGGCCCSDGGSLSVYPFCLKTFVSGSFDKEFESVSESLRFEDVGDDDGSVLVFVGIDSTIYKLALFFVALVISLH